MQTSMMRSDFLGATLKKEAAPQRQTSAKVQVQALLKKAAKPAKKATAVVKKAAPAVKKAASGKKTKGWLGGEGGPGDLSKWYGK
jgi:hypothetical protein